MLMAIHLVHMQLGGQHMFLLEVQDMYLHYKLAKLVLYYLFFCH